MKKLFISALSMLAVAMGFTACTSDDVTSTPDTPKQITVYATTEQPSATRTSLNVDEGSETDGYEVLWSAGDQIKLINEASIYAVFTLNNEYDEKSTGEFTGSSPDDGTYTAYYPADYDGTSWPTAQTYVENNIPEGVPMKAENVEVADGDVAPISFKNEGGILRLNLKGKAKVTSITISATDLDAITLSCGTAVQLDADLATPFYIAVPGADAGTAYSGLKIEITDDAGKVCTKTAKVSITVQRSMITDITLTASGFKATTGTAKATIGGSEVDVNWVQLWAGGPKFADRNVGASSATEAGTKMAFADAIKTGTADVWGENWCTPSIDQMDELLKAATTSGSEKVKCEIVREGNVETGKIIGFKFTGKKTVYTENSVFFPVYSGLPVFGKASYWSATEYDKDTAHYTHLEYNSSGLTSEKKPISKDNKYFVRPVLKN